MLPKVLRNNGRNNVIIDRLRGRIIATDSKQSVLEIELSEAIIHFCFTGNRHSFPQQPDASISSVEGPRGYR